MAKKIKSNAKPDVKRYAYKREKEAYAYVEEYVYPYVIDLLTKARKKVKVPLALRWHSDADCYIEKDGYPWVETDSVELLRDYSVSHRTNEQMRKEYPELFAALRTIEEVVELLDVNVANDCPIICARNEK